MEKALKRILAVAVDAKAAWHPDVVSSGVISQLRLIIQRLNDHLSSLRAKQGHPFDIVIDYVQGPPGPPWGSRGKPQNDLEKIIQEHLPSHDLVFTVTSAATKAAQRMVDSWGNPDAVPIVFTVVSEPMRPGEHIVATETDIRTNRTTGVSTSLAQNVAGCALRFWDMLSPHCPDFMIHYMYRDPQECDIAYNAHEHLGKEPKLRGKLKSWHLGPNDDPVGMVRDHFPVNRPGNIAHGLLLAPDDKVYSVRDGVIAAALQKYIPTFVQDPDLVDPANSNRGPIAGYGLSSDATGRYAADLVFQVLQDPNAANVLPVGRPLDFTSQYNAQLAAYLGP